MIIFYISVCFLTKMCSNRNIRGVPVHFYKILVKMIYLIDVYLNYGFTYA